MSELSERALKAEQTKRNGDTMRNDRFIGIPSLTQLISKVKMLEQLPEAILSQLEAFFNNYNEQTGKQFRVTARLNAAQAAQILDK